MIHEVNSRKYVITIVLLLGATCAWGVPPDRVTRHPKGDVRVTGPGALSPMLETRGPVFPAAEPAARGADELFTERVISTAPNGARSGFATGVVGDGDTDVLSVSLNDGKMAWSENTALPTGWDVWNDDIEPYANGSNMHGQGGWKGWNGNSGAGALVTQAQNHTIGGLQSVEIVTASDLVHPFSGHTTGVWNLSAWQYVPSGLNAPDNQYFIVQKEYNDGGPYQWSIQLWVANDGTVHCDCGAGDNGALAFWIPDAWNLIEAKIDLDSDWVELRYNGTLLGAYQWSAGVFGDDSGCPAGGCIGAINLFADGGSSVYYDDLALEGTSCPQTCLVGYIDENESDCGGASHGGDAFDTVNGGCWDPPFVFSKMTCGDTYCGTIAADGGRSDVDAYFFELTEQTSIVGTLTPELTSWFYLYSTDQACTYSDGLEGWWAYACEERSISACLDPGTYAFYVRTGGMQEGIPCAPAYTLELTCDVCRGACCDFDTSTCTENVTAAACSGPNVTWHAELSCAESGCIGACCNTSTNACAEQVFTTVCTGPNEEFVAGAECCEVECRDPAGPEYDSSGVDLLSNVTIADFDTFVGIGGIPYEANEMWGYRSPSGGEYGIIGLNTGTAFVNVDVPTNPVIIEYIDAGVDTVAHDMSTYGNHAYLTAGGGFVGLQIVDLTDIDSGVVTLVNTTDLGVGYGEAHNLHINPDSGFLYLAIPDLNGGQGLTVVDLNSDPVNPTVAGTWTDTDADVRCHDVHVVSYTTGPNAGKEIAFCPAENDGLKIVDVTDKGNMFTISTLVYPNTTYAHQTRVSDDGQFVFLGDEIDEREDPDVTETTTYVINVSDLSNPTLEATFSNGLCAVDHNMMVRGNYLFEANYSTGLRVFNVCDVNNVVEIGYFDTRPEDNVQDYLGAWGVYTQLPSGIVLVSDRQRGLFVLDVSDALAAADTNGDGIPDNCDVPLNPPALPPDAEHQALKHRYLSIDATTNAPEMVALKVELVEYKRCAGDRERACTEDSDCGPGGVNGPCDNNHPAVGLTWWVQPPQEYVDGCRLRCDTHDGAFCNADGECPLNDCSKKCGATDQFARLAPTATTLPYFSDWIDPRFPLTTLHIGDCEVVPIGTYEVRACSQPDGDVCGDPLRIGTINQSWLPGVRANFGDIVKAPNVAGDPYGPPDGITNVSDQQALSQILTNWPGMNTPQIHVTWADLHGNGIGSPPQYFPNAGDLQMFKQASGPNETWTGAHSDNRHPNDCPP